VTNNEQLPTRASMTLWQLLTATAGAAAIGGALSAAALVENGAIGWFLGGGVGLCLGVGAMMLADRLGKAAYAYLGSSGEKKQKYAIPVMYTALVGWILLAGYLGSTFTRVILGNGS
jgi:hypothetical protein